MILYKFYLDYKYAQAKELLLPQPSYIVAFADV